MFEHQVRCSEQKNIKTHDFDNFSMKSVAIFVKCTTFYLHSKAQDNTAGVDLTLLIGQQHTSK